MRRRWVVMVYFVETRRMKPTRMSSAKRTRKTSTPVAVEVMSATTTPITTEPMKPVM